ncbi:MAG: hypothetical protein ISS74_01400 [Planctomycetes bacterium]|nr:hypothetical protein [Planctomycetota bacterium]
MFETVKRHAFLLGLGGGVVVIAALVILLVYFSYVGPNAALERELKSTKSQAEALLNGKLYSAELVDKMAEQIALRNQQYKDLLAYIKELGVRRQPLVKDLFPTSTDISLRHSFKAQYDNALGKFMEQLGAIQPKRPEGTGGSKKDGPSQELEAAMAEARSHTMYAHPKQSFIRPDWLDAPEAPPLAETVKAQEDIWLMQDIVAIIAKMNSDILKATGKTAEIARAPLKELIRIEVGGENAVLPDAGMQSIAGRYRPSAPPGGKGGPGGRMPTLSGHGSNFGFYKALPWRLEVIAEAAYVPELVRRLRGTESFLSVEAWSMTPITEAQFERGRVDLMAYDREDYGEAGVVRLEVVGESLIFELPGGRVTNPVAAAPATPGPETESTGE